MFIDLFSSILDIPFSALWGESKKTSWSRAREGYLFIFGQSGISPAAATMSDSKPGLCPARRRPALLSLTSPLGTKSLSCSLRTSEWNEDTSWIDMVAGSVTADKSSPPWRVNVLRAFALSTSPSIIVFLIKYDITRRSWPQQRTDGLSGVVQLQRPDREG